MSKERARNRAAREREAGIKAAARGSDQERQERTTSHPGGKAAVPGGRQAPKAAARAKNPRPGAATPPKKNRPRPAPAKPRRTAPSGRPDGPLARRRRLRIRLLVLLLLAVNVVAGVVWQDWKISLAVFILTVITAPLFAALFLRRRR